MEDVVLDEQLVVDGEEVQMALDPAYPEGVDADRGESEKAGCLR